MKWNSDHRQSRRQAIVRHLVLTTLLVSPTLLLAGPPDRPDPDVPVADYSPDRLWSETGAGLVSADSRPIATTQSDEDLGQDQPERPGRYRALNLDVEQLREMLREVADGAFHRSRLGVRLSLPVGDRGYKEFLVKPSPVMDEDLADRYTDILMFAGEGTGDAASYVRFTMSDRGLEALVRTPDGSWSIQPEVLGNGEDYVAFNRAALGRPDLNEDPADFAGEALDVQDLDAPAPSGDGIRVYRLAVSTSQEYYSNNGGTDASVMAAIAARVSQLNAIYEYELSVRFTLVANNDLLLNQAIADNGSPFNSNTGVINNLLAQPPGSGTGANFYDIGHVFLRDYGGGVAGLGVICGGSKGRGQTGVNANLEVLAHEIGHQFGMYHSWNSCGGNYGSQRTASAAFEPGSGTTLMSYNGSCGADNMGEDLNQFHANSFAQAQTRILATACHTVVPNGNLPPVVTVTSGTMDIPADTPFVLKGSATDGDGDSLLYSWEEMDLEQNDPDSVSPPTAPGNDVAPFFRVYAPVPEDHRTFPKMDDVLAGTSTFGENLPSSDKNLNFRLHVYDGNGGVAFQSSDTQVIVDGTAGPFRVTAPNGGESWAPGASVEVTWNVAGTGPGSAVDCDDVAIELSTNGGQTFTTPLDTSTPNDGSEFITVPSVSTTAARLRVRCADLPDHFFFDVADADFAVDATPLPGDCPASGPAITVNSLEDVSNPADGECTLREALSAVDNGGTVDFDPALSNGTIELFSQIALASKSFTLEGGGLSLTISGRNLNRLFCLSNSGSTPDILMRNLTLADGRATGSELCGGYDDEGGAVILNAVNATFERMVFEDSLSYFQGGAIYWWSGGNRTLTVRDSTFRGNQARWTGGAMRLRGPTVIERSTFEDNSAYYYSNAIGGALSLNAPSSGTRFDVEIRNSTFHDNYSRGNGGAIGDFYSPHQGYPAETSHTDLFLHNTTIWENAAYDGTDNLQHNGVQVEVYNSIIGGTPNPACDRAVDVNVGNLVQDNSCGVPAVNGNPLLGPLADNGGITRTMKPGAGSPALNNGNNGACEALDQRGYARSAGGNCDIGAVEAVTCDAGETYTVPDSSVEAQWRMLSLPCVPAGSDTPVAVLGDDLPGAYGTDWALWRFNAAHGATGRYEQLASTDSLLPGVGYWVLHIDGGGSWSMDSSDTLNELPFEAAIEPPRGGGQQQWNLVGNPTQGDLNWAEMTVVDEYGNCYGSPTIASEVGPTGDDFGLVDKAIHTYTGASYSTCDDSPPPGPACTIPAGAGFFVQAKDSGMAALTLRYGGSCASASPAALQDPPRDRLDARDNEANPAGWAAVISVRSGGMNDPTLVLGQVENGEFGHDARDLVELDPDREPWLTAVFPHPEWGEQAGDYGHDYHPWHDGSDEWHFVVRTGEELNSALVLRWRAPEDILARSQLVDLDTGEVIDMQKGRKLRGSWSTQWHGQTERHFAWVLEPGGRSNAVDRPVDGRAGSAVEQPEGGRRHESGDPSPQKGVEKAR